MTSHDKSNKKRIGWLLQTGLAFRREWATIFSDMGVMIFFIILPLAYPIVYTLIYNPEVVTRMPVAIVDNSRSEMSRELVRTMEAAPAISIYGYCADMGEAKRLFAENKVFGIVEIPADYEKKIMRGEQATVPFYAEVSLLLRYRAYLSALTDIQLKLATDITATRLSAAGASSLGLQGLPIETNGSFLGDPGQGFASFVMPGIIILIIQQSMVLGICLIGGTARERRNRMAPQTLSSTAIVIGKALCHTIFYIPVTIYVVHFIPEIFGLPHQGAPADYLLFLLPFLLASALFGQMVQLICKERESTFVIVVFTSVLFLFLSGLTWPRYAMNRLWTLAGDLVPATWGIEGFIRINSNAATLAENATPYIALWIMTIVYFFGAWWVTSYIRRHPSERHDCHS